MEKDRECVCVFEFLIIFFLNRNTDVFVGLWEQSGRRSSLMVQENEEIMTELSQQKIRNSLKCPSGGE